MMLLTGLDNDMIEHKFDLQNSRNLIIEYCYFGYNRINIDMMSNNAITIKTYWHIWLIQI